MDLNSITDLIITRFKDTSQEQLIEEINFIINRGSTGGEIAAGVGRYLLNLEKNNPLVYNEVKDLVHSYIEECSKYGLRFKS